MERESQLLKDKRSAMSSRFQYVVTDTFVALHFWYQHDSLHPEFSCKIN